MSAPKQQFSSLKPLMIGLIDPHLSIWSNRCPTISQKHSGRDKAPFHPNFFAIASRQTK